MREPSPQWRLLLEGDNLVASGGADEQYLLDELTPPLARALFDAWNARAIERLAPDPVLDRVLLQLERRHILVRAKPSRSIVRYALRGGDVFEQRLAALLPNEGFERVADDADLEIFVRTHDTMTQLLKEYGPPSRPHLLVEAAYHHTIVVGPLVWPGETACLSCAQGRIRHIWGDPQPPSAPAVMDRAGVAAGIVADALMQFRRVGNCPALVEQTWSLDLDTLRSRLEPVHRLPWCPFCYPPSSEQGYGSGSFARLWSEE